MAKTPRIGDIFQIPLSNGKKAFGQYLNYSRMGPVVQVFDLLVEAGKAPNLAQILASNPRFPPVITGLFAAVRDGMWVIIGNSPVKNFVHPQFVSALYDESTGEVRKWSIWDGEKFTKVGRDLTPEQKALEYLVVWNPADIRNRIETGDIPFPYGDLIRKNRFTPFNY